MDSLRNFAAAKKKAFEDYNGAKTVLKESWAWGEKNCGDFSSYEDNG